MGTPWRRLAINKRVLINLKSGRAIAGVLWDERGGLLVLKEASLHGPDVPAGAQLDGDVVIERADIDFAQLLPVTNPGG